MPLSDFLRDLDIDEDIPIEIEKLDDYESTEVIFVDDFSLDMLDEATIKLLDMNIVSRIPSSCVSSELNQDEHRSKKVFVCERCGKN